MAAVEPLAGHGWRGTLELEFAARPGGTVLATRRHEGPLYVQRPFYPGDGVCHAYLLHPPGGIAGGDELTIAVTAAPGAAALLTTPAATKFYGSDVLPGIQRQHLVAAAESSLEWLPQESILYGGSRAELTTVIELDAAARFVGWEQLVLGRPWSGDHYASATLVQRTRIDVAGETALDDTLRWRSGDRLLTAEWGLAGFGVCGVLYAYPADARLLALIREQLGAATPSRDDAAAAEPLRHGATLLDRLLVVRCLAHEPERLRTLFEALWTCLRPHVAGRKPSAPRIWRT
jgi:urease accessory protein